MTRYLPQGLAVDMHQRDQKALALPWALFHEHGASITWHGRHRICGGHQQRPELCIYLYDVVCLLRCIHDSPDEEAEILPGLTIRGIQSGKGRLTLHDIERAAALNQEHRAAFAANQRGGTSNWIQPHDEGRLVVEYHPDQPARFARVYRNGGNLKGSRLLPHCFVTSTDQIPACDSRNRASQCAFNLPYKPRKLASVTVGPGHPITQTRVAGSSTGATQYMVPRTAADFQAMTQH